jgi:SpoIIAA-like
MIEDTLDTAHSILYVRPKSPLEKSDFQQIAATVDPFIEKTGDLAGLVIEVEDFVGWENLGAMVEHFRFVRDHHRHIKKVAVVTNSVLGRLAEHLASHFVSAEIKHFAQGELELARQWIIAGDPGEDSGTELGGSLTD